MDAFEPGLRGFVVEVSGRFPIKVVDVPIAIAHGVHEAIRRIAFCYGRPKRCGIENFASYNLDLIPPRVLHRRLGSDLGAKMKFRQCQLC